MKARLHLPTPGPVASDHRQRSRARCAGCALHNLGGSLEQPVGCHDSLVVVLGSEPQHREEAARTPSGKCAPEREDPSTVRTLYWEEPFPWVLAKTGEAP